MVDFHSHFLPGIDDGAADVPTGAEMLRESYRQGVRLMCATPHFYADEDAPCYPEDVDCMAKDYFGEEKYNCEEFQNEAYLFVPYGEEYYVRITKYINENYRKFSGLAQ